MERIASVAEKPAQARPGDGPATRQDMRQKTLLLVAQEEGRNTADIVNRLVASYRKKVSERLACELEVLEEEGLVGVCPGGEILLTNQGREQLGLSPHPVSSLLAPCKPWHFERLVLQVLATKSGSRRYPLSRLTNDVKLLGARFGFDTATAPTTHLGNELNSAVLRLARLEAPRIKVSGSPGFEMLELVH